MTKIKILVVDDNAQMRNLLRLTFSAYPQYIFLQAQSGQEAIDIIKAEHPTIIFLDIMMPGDIDGLDVCAFVKSAEEFKSSVVVLLSAKGQKQDIAAGMQAGADKYITKPFSPIALLDVVTEICAMQTQ
ncbi:MAG: response regulator [Methylococcales bacterium]|nr:response regulator [Methylococcales bacterium]